MRQVVVIGVFLIVAWVSFIARLRGRITPNQWFAIGVLDLIFFALGVTR